MGGSNISNIEKTYRDFPSDFSLKLNWEADESGSFGLEIGGNCRVRFRCWNQAIRSDLWVSARFRDTQVPKKSKNDLGSIFPNWLWKLFILASVRDMGVCQKRSKTCCGLATRWQPWASTKEPSIWVLASPPASTSRPRGTELRDPTDPTPSAQPTKVQWNLTGRGIFRWYFEGYSDDILGTIYGEGWVFETTGYSMDLAGGQRRRRWGWRSRGRSQPVSIFHALLKSFILWYSLCRGFGISFGHIHR